LNGRVRAAFARRPRRGGAEIVFSGSERFDRKVVRRRAALFTLAAVLGCAVAPLAARAQSDVETGAGAVRDGELVQLDFTDVELPVVIDTMARLSNQNYIYDDRVRGRVTIVSPTKMTIEQAVAVFDSVLQVKGFTRVRLNDETWKILPIREGKETNIETIRESEAMPASDRFVTRLIPLKYIDAQAIAETLKPLVSKDASMVAYPPTNTVILTDSASNITRILDLIDSIDIETYKEELAVIKVEHADATTLADQISQIFGAEVADPSQGAGGVGAARARARRPVGQVPGAPVEMTPADHVRIITDARTNSLIVLAARTRLEEIRRVVAKLDVEVPGGGRIHVYYLKHADAEELSQTLNALISGQAVPSSSGGAAGSSRSGRTGVANVAAQAAAAASNPAIRSAITELAEGVSITADPPTNSLVIQASKEGYQTVRGVIDALDRERPQVLVEALIMEVDVSDNEELGFSGLIRILDEDKGGFGVGTFTDTGLGAFGGADGGDDDDDDDPDDPDDPDPGDPAPPTAIDLDSAQALLGPLLAGANPGSFLTVASVKAGSTLIQGVIRASSTVNGTNILSAPNILTADNEEAEIKVGANIPIIANRVQSASGIDDATGNDLATSVNVERQDIGVTLRVTPQISEGDAVRMEIFQEITDVNAALSLVTGRPEDVGVALSSRKVENTVVVSNHQTVVIGGLIQDDYRDNENKIPWLGDIPFLGWLFKTTDKEIRKTNLLVFLTPHIVRSPADHERETIRKREEFWDASEAGMTLTEAEEEERQEREEEALAAGLPPEEYSGRNPVRGQLVSHSRRYPLDRMREIEEADAERKRLAEEAAAAALRHPHYTVLAAVYRNERAATDLLTDLVDAGYDGTLVASSSSGSVLYEIRVGPYPEMEDAQRAAESMAGAYGLSPEVLVQKPEPPPEDVE
jgi:general secretion pathway protein D